MMERKPFRPRKIVDYSKFADDDSDSDDFAQPASKKNKVKHQSVDPTTVKNSNLTKSTSTAKRTNKQADVKVTDKSKIKDIIVKIKKHDDGHFTTIIDSEEDSQKNCSGDKPSTNDVMKKITVKDLPVAAKKEIAKSEIKENEEQLIKCEVSSATAEPNKKKDEKAKSDSCQLKVSENDKRSPEINKSIKSNRKEKITCDRKLTDMSISKPTSPLIIEEKDKMEISRKTKESNHLAFTENVDQQKNIRKWKPPTRTVVNSELQLKSPLSTSNSGLRLGLSRNIRTKPLHSNVKIQS